MPLNMQDLRESNEFLNILFEKIPSLVMLVDQDFHVQEINDASQVLFGIPREVALGQLCGNALQCAFAVTEHKLCGETSYCDHCLIRKSAMATLVGKVPVDREKLVHTFYILGIPEERHFEFSTRYVTFQGEEMVLIILYDVTMLERQKSELVSKQIKIDDALKAAGGVQRCLLPRHLPDSDHVEFAWKFKPCDEIGGDILNVLPLDGAHMGLYMLDVAGHGPPSAMISVLVYQLMNPHTGILVDHSATPPTIRDPEAVLDILDREFPLMRFKRHFTIVYAVLDQISGQLRYSNAAHCVPIILPRNGGLKLLEVSGTVIGLGVMPFGQETVQLEPGDKVVLLSDGVVEMQNNDNEIWGEERLHKTLIALRSAPVTKLVQGLYDEALRFGGEQPAGDDVSILAFEFKG